MQLIWFGTRQQLINLDFAFLAESFPSSTFLSSVRDLGVSLDSTLTFFAHIFSLTRCCHFQLRRLRAMRRTVSSSTFSSMVHAFIFFRMAYSKHFSKVF